MILSIDRDTPPRRNPSAYDRDADEGNTSDCRAGSARNELRGGEQRGRRDQPVDQAVDGSVDVPHSEVDAELTRSDSLERSLQLFRKRLDQMVPRSRGPTGAPGDPVRGESLCEHRLDVGGEQFGEAHFRTNTAAESLESHHYTEQQREIGRQHEPVFVHHLRPAREDRHDIEVCDITEEVLTDPKIDIASELRDVDV